MLIEKNVEEDLKNNPITKKEKEKIKKRPAFRMTPKGDVHDPESVCWTVDRYGAIKGDPGSRIIYCRCGQRDGVFIKGRSKLK